MSSSPPTTAPAAPAPVRQKTFTDHSGQEVTVVHAPADAKVAEAKRDVVVENKKPDEKVVVVEKKPEEKKDVVVVEEKKPEEKKEVVVVEKKPEEKKEVVAVEGKKPEEKKTVIVEEKKPVTTTAGDKETTAKTTTTTTIEEKKPAAATTDDKTSAASTKTTTTTTTTTTVVDTFVVSKPVGVFTQYKTPGSVNLVLNKDVVTNSVGKAIFKVRRRASLPLFSIANLHSDPRQRHQRRHHQRLNLDFASQMSPRFLVRRATSSAPSRKEHPPRPLQNQEARG